MENDIMIRDICLQYYIQLMIIDIIIIWEYIIDEGRWFSSYPSRAIYERHKLICIHDIQYVHVLTIVLTIANLQGFFYIFWDS